eukprot:CAMPEP_0175643346 /NCGR_PEP_ID=MMETSP0097-20121207/5744_1 /TAXON_ID=311494 /ORGANISM="Alexandrium monilatum, Strain CCMP3105" /LENGTH=115 /DNA_ID=CAMNT_0016949181 /DNA_START=534 /DNA_END=878 /DNA_ORIENTATION=-
MTGRGQRSRWTTAGPPTGFARGRVLPRPSSPPAPASSPSRGPGPPPARASASSWQASSRRGARWLPGGPHAALAATREGGEAAGASAREAQQRGEQREREEPPYWPPPRGLHRGG